MMGVYDSIKLKRDRTTKYVSHGAKRAWAWAGDVDGGADRALWEA